MDFKQWDQERYMKYLKDVELAQEELKNMKLFPDRGILCDLYAVPSHNHQAYYAVVYENHGRMELVYAKPVIYEDHFSEPIKMYSFEMVKEAEQYVPIDARIIMGIRGVPADIEAMLIDIMENIPHEHFLGENKIIIDGVLQAVRVYQYMNIVKSIIYRETEDIELSRKKTYLREVLENLYLKIEKLLL